MPFYAEECASMLAVTFSGGDKMLRSIVSASWAPHSLPLPPQDLSQAAQPYFSVPCFPGPPFKSSSLAGLGLKRVCHCWKIRAEDSKQICKWFLPLKF